MKRIVMIITTAVMLSVLIMASKAAEIRISAEIVEKTVKAHVVFLDNPGIAGFSLNMLFDKEKLTPVAIETGEAFSGKNITSNIQLSQDLSALDSVSAVWIGTSDVKTDGILYTVIFKINDSAEGNTELSLYYKNGNISNSALKNVDFDVTGAVLNLNDGKADNTPTVPGDTFVPPTDTLPDEIPDEKPFEPKKVYADVNESDWYFSDVAYVYEKGLMTGTSNEPELLFSPLIHTNRAMFVTVLYRMEGEPEAKTSSFDDVERGSYYEKAVNWAAANGIVSGISSAEFAPLSPITREQTAKIIANYAMYKKLSIPEKKADITAFSDYVNVSGWAVDALQICADMDIIRGRNDNTLDPQGKTTRAETAAILKRLVTYGK
ncbi:MAG: hypothetical protein E7588_07695 [Ruminococcaceae bacterium]|nr:hypothetical protein [Oscillospiraceae bacterium]